MDGNLLLCELHAHTTWSDGVLTVTELVDLYGRHEFDVLCITDHALRSDFAGYRLQPHRYPTTWRPSTARRRAPSSASVIPGAELTISTRIRTKRAALGRPA